MNDNDLRTKTDRRRDWLVTTALAVLLILSFAARAIDPPEPAKAAKPADPSKVLELDWEELIPATERASFDALPPAPVHDYLSGEMGPGVPQRMSVSVNKELDGLTVKLPGFIVPLDLDAQNRVTEFFLVPYFGACIHVPPPPPNQIVYVKFAQGIALESMYEAYWITGKMKTKSQNTRYGLAAYTLAGETFEVYKY